MTEPCVLAWRAGSAGTLLSRLELDGLPAAEAALLDKKGRERWLMAGWLAVRAHALAYPLRVLACERPDFLLDGPGLKMGMECMEVVPAEFKRLQTELREVNSGWVEPLRAPGQFEWDWSNPVLAGLLARTHRQQPSPEDPRALWLSVMQWAVAKKRDILHRNGFQRRPVNGLLLHDNWPLAELDPLPVERLHRSLLEAGAYADFQLVAFMREGRVWQLEATGVIEPPRPASNAG
jgi:hypothetical protein